MNDYNFIKSYKPLFKSVINYFNNNWDVLKLPFIYIKPPFDDIYNNYIINNNNIQLLNYNEYLLNSNTQYCISFANKLVINIYNTFKVNIGGRLSNKNYNITYNLCNKLIINGISDREIYMYICICAVYLNKFNTVYKYIEDSKPLCYNQPILKKYYN